MSGIELKGLDGLLRETKKHTPSSDGLTFLATDVLVPGKYQPRTEFDNAELQALATSIKKNGIIQPIIVRKIDSFKYEIIAGERRWRSAKIVGLTAVPVVIRNIPDDTAMAFSLVENIQRENLNPIEQAFALSRLSEEFLLTHEKIAEIVGFSRATISNLIRLLSLTPVVKDLVKHKKIEVGHAKLLLTLDERQQLYYANRIVEKGLSVRESEKIVQVLKKKKDSFNVDAHDFDLQVQEISQALSKKISHSINIRVNKQGRGKIEVLVDSFSDLQELVEKIKMD